MHTFLEEVVHKLFHKHGSFDDIVFVLPSKRAGTFLKNYLSEKVEVPFFAPPTYSIETFVEEIAGITYASHTDQLFQLYASYLEGNPKKVDSFTEFSKWATTILSDFNEIDRYLIHTGRLFSYLSDIQEINHWFLATERTPLMSAYVHFWNSLETLYENFNASLLQKGMGHQGLVYREAAKKCTEYVTQNSTKKFVFIGFNALNSAEKKIIQEFLKSSSNEIYWDIDPYFLNDFRHDAGYFIRQYAKEWATIGVLESINKKSTYLSEKHIQIIGVPKHISQAKYVGSILKNLASSHPERLKQTAVVLGDETLLNPVLHAVPESITHVNITMGYPLRQSSLAGLFTQLLEMHRNRSERGWHHRSVLLLLANPFIKMLFQNHEGEPSLRDEINAQNWLYINKEQLKTKWAKNAEILDILFLDKLPNATQFLTQCIVVIQQLKKRFTPNVHAKELEQLYRFHSIFQVLLQMVSTYHFIHDLGSVESLYKELLAKEMLDFQGEPLQGLQIMGMLESRNLDFETVIITSVNEGILPSGKTNNSFIPFDVKRAFGLPTYKEKDAVYTYHFYHLLQRAKHIYVLYNTEPDVLEGREKSRLIQQLVADEHISGKITEIIATPEIPSETPALEIIAKDDALMQRIKETAENGFSPSSLSNYIRNPIDFYKQSILKIKDTVEVEETLAYNTFGTVVHDALEELYRPLLGQRLTPELLNERVPAISGVVKTQFNKKYSDTAISQGKNLIAYNVVVRYIENFINLEISECKTKEIVVLALEEKRAVTLDFPELNFPVVLHGKLDRIDRINGKLRIIDYKTGTVAATQVEIVDWPEIVASYDQSKAFQLLCYAYMYSTSFTAREMEAGIIAFKNLKSSPFMFATKPKKGSRTKDHTINEQTLQQFYVQLKALILEICNPQIPFTEKEVT
ncbi:PD-(D/E)XK nuclease family protein [Arenibacter sp. GZD96]|uniref:PD-(D/E)XK nuclease family protein n=1 Tax=Aurantibrevibacter litoralis TaxID=3106030 RepID=UPI002B000D1F|nr:PD-(D/E)XK nuclease family protein [Arenibacter sp. GZD-96]MEA1786573.1 PD-(D/E)XK nuclease family protein [Arenibacter sp. GZD-96]